MAKSELEIIIGIKDSASGPLARLRGALGGIATIAGGILGAQVLTRIATGLYNLGAGAIEAASNLNEAMNATSVVFGEAAAKVQEFGAIAAETTGLSAAAFNQMSAQAGAMLKNFGLSADAAADQTINLAQRAADMASIFNTDVSDAMTAILAMLRGEGNPIERFGVSITAATVQAKALELGLEQVDGQFTQAALTQARLALFFEQTNDIAGDFVNTSDELANATRVNQARWENFRAEVGTNFLPIMQTFQGLLMDLGTVLFPVISDAMKAMAPTLQAWSKGIANVIAALVDAGPNSIEFREALTSIPNSEIGAFIGGVIEKLAEFGAWFKDVGLPAIKDFASMIWEQLGPGLVQLGEWLFELARIVLPILAGAIQFVIDNWNIFGPILAVIGGLILALTSPITFLIAALVLLATAWANNWGGIQEKFAAVWEFLEPKFTAIKEWLEEKIPLAIETLSTFWEEKLKPAMERFLNWNETKFQPALKELDRWVGQKLTTAIQTLSDYWETTLQPAMARFLDWNETTFQPALTELDRLVGEKLTASIQALSDYWGTTLQPAIERFLNWNRETLQPALAELDRAVGELLVTSLGLLADAWGSDLQPAIESFLAWNSSTLQPALDELDRKVGEVLTTTLQNFASGALAAVASGFQGILDTIISLTQWIDTLTEKLKGLEPSKHFKPGSPTPFELGLRGITDAMRQISTMALPQFAAQLQLAGPAGAMFLGGPLVQSEGGGVVQNITQNFYNEGAAALGMAIVTTQSRARLRGRLGLK